MLRFFTLALCSARSSAPTADEIKAYLDEHNKLRCLHGHPQMTWDDGTSKTAEAWAKKSLATGVFRHSSRRYRHGAGENIAWQAGPNKQNTVKHIGEMIQDWYSEIEFCASDTCDKSRSYRSAIGHFTQVIWKDSIKLGCGHATGSHPRYGEQIYFVCQYSPAGNYISRRGHWIPGKVTTKTVKTDSECGIERYELGNQGDDTMVSFRHPAVGPKILLNVEGVELNELTNADDDILDIMVTEDMVGATSKSSGALSSFSIAIMVIAILEA